MVKNPPTKPETQVQCLGQEAPLEKEMATYSSIFAWENAWTEEPSGLQFMGCQRAGENLATKPQQREEMDRFIALPGKEAHSGPCPQDHVSQLGKTVTSFILIIQRECDQLEDILLIGS